MAKADSVVGEDGRLSAEVAATLDRKLQDVLDHPIRRELLRTLTRCRRPRNFAELEVDLRPFRPGQLGYHLQVLRQSGLIAAGHVGASAVPGCTRYASEVSNSGKVRAILRATEQGDRERREAAVAANASPLLTMFRVPRPVRTIRLRGRSGIDAERER